MKIKSLLLVFPVLCLACSNSSTDPTDPAYQTDASPIMAKKVVGVNTLSVDFNYDEPCNIIGEDYLRETFNLEKSVELEEAHHTDGCEFSWAGNKVLVSFGGVKPFASTFLAEYQFNKLFQGKSDKAMAAVTEAHAPALIDAAEGTNPEAITPSAAVSKHDSTSDEQPNHGGVSAAEHKLTGPAVSVGSFAAVSNVGDKAVWNEEAGILHVLYNNNIINVTVESKDKAEVKKERAISLAEVIIDKITENEYVRHL